MEASFNDSRYNGTADFQGAGFTGYTDFTGSHFAGDADFSNTKFEGAADFSRSQFCKEACLFGAQFLRNAYLESCQIACLNLTGASYPWIFLRWDSIEKFNSDADAYSFILKNYENLGWQEDASECSSDFGRRGG